MNRPPNQEVAREALHRWSAGDLDGTLATMRPDVEWTMAFELPDLPRGKHLYRGHDEVRQLWEAFRSVWEEIVIELEEVLYDEGGLMVAQARFHARGGGSGIELERVVFYVFELDAEGLLARLRPFDTADEALAALEQ